MAQSIAWRRGTFLKFYAAMKIRVGGEKSLDIMSGDEFEYDGSVVKYAGAEFQQLGLRGAISNGWATLDPDSQERIAPVVPVRDVAKSQSKGTDLSRVQRTKAMQLEVDSLDENTVLNVEDRRPNVAENPRAVPNKLLPKKSTAGQRVSSLQITQSDIDAQEGVVVGRVTTPAKLKVEDITKEGNLASAIENRGPSNPEFYKPKKNVVVKEGVTITMNVGQVEPAVHLSQEDEGRVVGKVKKSKTVGNSDGVTVRDTSNIRTEKKTIIPKAGPVASAKEKSLPKNLSQKHKVALSFYPDFPVSYNFVAPVKERLSILKKQSKNPGFLKALYAVEGESFKKEIEKQFPNLFS